MLELRDPATKQVREFLVRKRFPQTDFYTRIQVEENKKRLLLFRFSKKLLQDRDLTSHLYQTIHKIDSIHHSAMNRTQGVLEDSQCLYVVMVDDILCTLQQLIAKRQRLTEFQLKYFVVELYYSLNHLRAKGFVFTKLSMQNLSLDSSVKINFGFSMWISEIENIHKVKRTMKMNHIALESCCESDDPERIILWEIALIYYNLLEGEPLISNSNHRKQINNQKLRVKHTDPGSEAYSLLTKMLFSKQFKFSDLMYQPMLSKEVSRVLPESILFCPPSKRFQQDIIKTIRLQESLNEKKTIRRVQSDEEKNNKQEVVEEEEEDHEIVYVDEFCDITAKFGYGYKMSNGVVGFYFNDRTLLLLLEQSSNRELRYFDENWVEKVYKEDKLIDEHDIKKKLNILDAFRKAVCQFKKPATAFKKIVYIKNYVKVKNARLFLLSNNTSQSKFIDNSQILCLTSTNSLHFDKKAEEFIEITRDDPNQIIIRETYTKQLAIKLFDWLKVTEDKEEYQ